MYQDRLRIKEAVEREMDALGISQRRMAMELEIGRPLIKRVLSVESNFTIDSLLNVLYSLDLEIVIRKKAKGERWK
jgi:predicted XRE-type DNA-binding protein